MFSRNVCSHDLFNSKFAILARSFVCLPRLDITLVPDNCICCCHNHLFHYTDHFVINRGNSRTECGSSDQCKWRENELIRNARWTSWTFQNSYIHLFYPKNKRWYHTLTASCLFKHLFTLPLGLQWVTIAKTGYLNNSPGHSGSQLSPPARPGVSPSYKLVISVWKWVLAKMDKGVGIEFNSE